MGENEFLLYGANGYTGQLIAELASEYGLKPVIAGRREAPIRSLANKLQVDYRVGALENREQVMKVISGARVVLNAAGPFKYTAKAMIEACLANKTHYLDITGEMPVFEMAKLYNDKAIGEGIMVMPGVGFDVVPTDCLALFLKNKLPDACMLKLAFTTLHGGISHGTATTIAESVGEDGAVRFKGKIVNVPVGHKSMWIDFGQHRQLVMSIPWGDIATAYHTTGIPNIETYTGISPAIYRLFQFQKLYNWVLRTRVVRSYIKRRINNRAPGPSDEQRIKAKSLVWGEVTNQAGTNVCARQSGPEGYTLTAHSSLIILKKVFSGEFKPGYHTPAEMYGADLILEVPNVKRELI